MKVPAELAGPTKSTVSTSKVAVRVKPPFRISPAPLATRLSGRVCYILKPLVGTISNPYRWSTVETRVRRFFGVSATDAVDTEATAAAKE